MATVSPATKIVNEVARATLGPLGLVQRGRSRVWFDDHGWWITVVAFDSSGFGQGSYLHVAPDFLWNDRAYFSYNHGRRLAGFIPLDEPSQFRAEIERVSRLAVERVLEYRRDFPDISSWAKALTGPPRSWELFDSAIANALAGNESRARQVLTALRDEDLKDDVEWVRERGTRAAELLRLLDDRAEFVDEIARSVDRFRDALRLQPRKLELA